MRDCKNSRVFLLDWADSVTIDDCEGCQVYLGAVKGSVFLRDCRDCVLVAACGQVHLTYTELHLHTCCSSGSETAVAPRCSSAVPVSPS